MEPLEALIQTHALATMRLLPLLMFPVLSPFSFAPVLVRSVLLLGLASLLVALSPAAAEAMPQSLFLAALLAELSLGLVFALAFYLPIAALNFMGRLLDMQIGLAAAALLYPSLGNEPEAPISAFTTLAAQALFFALGLHLEALQAVRLSLELSPLGGGVTLPDSGALGAMLGAQFSLALLLAAPALTVLFALDLGTAYATRAMPQANVYFLMLPLKVLVGVLMVAVSLRHAPGVIREMFTVAQASLVGG